MPKWIKIKFKGSKCKACGQPFTIGEKANWYKTGMAFHKAKWEEVDGKWIATGCMSTSQEQLAS